MVNVQIFQDEMSTDDVSLSFSCSNFIQIANFHDYEAGL